MPSGGSTVAERAHEDDVGSTTEALLVATFAPIFALLLFFQGHEAMDRTEPALAAARTFYIAATLVGIGMAAALMRQGLDALWKRAAIALLIAVPMGWLLADAAQAYGAASFFAFFLVSFYLLPLVALVFVIGAIVAAVLSSRGKRDEGAAAFLVASCGIGFAVAGAALYHLVTLSHQADLAREAHDTPGLAVMLVVLALLGTALLRRK